MARRRTAEPERKSRVDAYSVAAGAALLLVARLALVPIRSDDLFFYLALGRRLFTEGGLPATDPYLFTLPGHRWEVLHEWGAYALTYLVHAAFGWIGLILGKTLLILAAHALPLLVARVYGFRSALVPVTIALSAFAGAPRFVERSSLFSDVLGTAVLAYAITAPRLGDRVRRWMEPAIVAGFALWANLHPGFLTGLVLLAVHAASRFVSGQPARRSWALLAAAAAACLLNPRGVYVFAYPLRPLLDPDWAAYRATNLEWRPTLSLATLTLTSALAFLGLAALCAGLLAWSLLRRTLRARDYEALFGLLAGAWLIYLGLSAVRFVLPASMGLALVATLLASRSPGWGAGRGGSAVSLALAAGVVYVVLQRETPGDRLPLPVPGAATALDETLLPVRAAEILDGFDPGLRVFNQHEFGGYLLWRFDGRRKVFYHGFVTDLRFYREDYVAVNRSTEDFARILDKYDIDAFLLANYPASSTRGPLLYRTLLSSRAWRLVHQDEAAVLFLKRKGSSDERNTDVTGRGLPKERMLLPASRDSPHPLPAIDR